MTAIYTFVFLLFFSYNCFASVSVLQARADLFDLVQQTAKLFYDVLNYNAKHPCVTVTTLPTSLLDEYNNLLKDADATNVVNGIPQNTLANLASNLNVRFSSTFIVSPTKYTKLHGYDHETWLVNSTYISTSTYVNYLSGFDPVTNNIYTSGTWDLVAQKISNKWVITIFTVVRVNTFGLPPGLPVIDCPTPTPTPTPKPTPTPPSKGSDDDDDDDDYKKHDDDDHKKNDDDDDHKKNDDDDDHKKHDDDDDHKKHDDDDHKKHDDDDDHKKHDDDDY